MTEPMPIIIQFNQGLKKNNSDYINSSIKRDMKFASVLKKFNEGMSGARTSLRENLSNSISVTRAYIIKKYANFNSLISNTRGYAAKIGETDDLVMSMLLAIRMATFLREFDPNLDEHLKDSSEDMLMPMPFIMT